MGKKLTKKKKNSVAFVVFIVTVCVVCFVGYFKGNEIKQYVSEISDLEQIVLPLPNDGLVKHCGYSLLYSKEHNQPFWVAYVLTPEHLNAEKIKRKDNFRADPFIISGSATPSDYKGSGYDRGHMAPYADLNWSEDSANDSFYMSNMSPQSPKLNRGKWADLEALVRSFAKNEAMCIVTGPVLTDGPYKSIGSNEVSVPNYYYKVVLDFVGLEKKAIAFIMPNSECTQDLSYYVCTVDKVEELTGLDFFSSLPDVIENKLESTCDYSLWVKPN